MSCELLELSALEGLDLLALFSPPVTRSTPPLSHLPSFWPPPLLLAVRSAPTPLTQSRRVSPQCGGVSLSRLRATTADDGAARSGPAMGRRAGGVGGGGGGDCVKQQHPRDPMHRTLFLFCIASGFGLEQSSG